MKKYSKVINQETKECEVGIGTNVEYYKKIGMTEQEVEQAYDGRWYLVGYVPDEPANNIILKQIIALESQQTPRLLRNAALGEQYAINKLQEIESSIANLRGQIK